MDKNIDIISYAVTLIIRVRWITFFWRCTVDARSVANNDPIYLVFSLLPTD
jgi:hypothetical protein